MCTVCAHAVASEVAVVPACVVVCTLLVAGAVVVGVAGAMQLLFPLYKLPDIDQGVSVLRTISQRVRRCTLRRCIYWHQPNVQLVATVRLVLQTCATVAAMSRPVIHRIRRS